MWPGSAAAAAADTESDDDTLLDQCLMTLLPNPSHDDHCHWKTLLLFCGVLNNEDWKRGWFFFSLLDKEAKIRKGGVKGER